MAYRLISRSRYPINNIEIYSGLNIISKTLQTKGDSIETDKLTDRIRSLHNMDMISIVDLSVESDRGVTPDVDYDIKIPEDIIDQDETSNEVTEDSEFTPEVTPEESEVTIISINDQLASANTGDTITLMEDTHLTDALIIDKDITINLNGHKLSSDGNVLDISANVTIDGDGEVIGGTGGNYVAVYARTGNITINGGTYSVGSDAEGSGNTTIYVNGDAVVTINGGHFSTESSYNDFYYVLNKKNGVGGTFIVNGGTFINYNPANGDDADGGSFLAEGCESTDTGDNVYRVNAVEVAAGAKRRRKTSTK